MLSCVLLTSVVHAEISTVQHSQVQIGEASNTGQAKPAFIARYQGNKRSAFSFTFDDGIRDQFTIAAPLLEKHGWRGTFFVIPGGTKASPEQVEQMKPGRPNGISWEEIKAMHAKGHEIGNHTMSHARLTTIKDETRLDKEINTSFDILNKKLGTAPYSFCYPFNARNKTIQKKVAERHHASRSHYKHYGGKGFKVQSHKQWMDDAVKNKKWVAGMFHGIKAGYSHFESLDLFTDCIDDLAQREENVWVAPFGDVAKYRKLYAASTLETLEHTDQRLTLSLTTTTDASIHDVYLTIAVPTVGRVEGRWVSTEGPRQGEIAWNNQLLLINAKPGDKPLVIEIKKPQ